MNPTEVRNVDDSTLVAWIDGELDEIESARVRAELARSDELRVREEMFRATRVAAREFLMQSEQVPTGAPRYRHRTEALLVIAAVTVLSVLFVWARGAKNDDTSGRAENDLVRLRLIPIRAAWPLFTDIAFELSIAARTTAPCRVLERGLDEEDAQVLAKRLAEKGAHASVLLLLDAEIVDPSGVRHRGKVLTQHGEFTQEAGTLRVALSDIVTPYDGVAPMCAGVPTEDGWGEDSMWPIRHRIIPTLGGQHGFLPEVTGDWRVRFELRGIASAGEAGGIRMDMPLSVETSFRVEGETGAFGDEVDGLRARLLVSRRVVEGSGPVFGLRLENRSDRSRAFNVAGMTLAKIPQPLHCELIVDGVAWTQRDRLPLVIPSESTFIPLPSGSTRSVIASADYWSLDGNHLADLPGPHRIAVRFHFEPTVWTGDGRDLWMGVIETAPVEIVVAQKR